MSKSADKDDVIERVCKVIKLNDETALSFAVVTAWVFHVACSETVFMKDSRYPHRLGCL